MIFFLLVCKFGLAVNSREREIGEAKLVDFLLKNYDPKTAPFSHNLTKHETYSEEFNFGNVYRFEIFL
jgi:hypothetical protein